MTLDEAVSFASDWASAWNRVDIDFVANHFAIDGEMTSPLAMDITGAATVKGREAIRDYWQRIYGRISSGNLQLEAVSWDVELVRLTVWWCAALPNGMTRACEYMDFGEDGLIVKSEAYYGVSHPG